MKENPSYRATTEVAKTFPSPVRVKPRPFISEACAAFLRERKSFLRAMCTVSKGKKNTFKLDYGKALKPI